MSTAVQNAAGCSRCGRVDSEVGARGFLRCPNCGFFRAVAETESPPQRQNSPVGEIFAPGQVLRGRYEIVARLGRGAHGVTYLARHQLFDYMCVVKALSATIADAAQATRVRTEARVGMQISSPNVVRVFDFDDV